MSLGQRVKQLYAIKSQNFVTTLPVNGFNRWILFYFLRSSGPFILDIIDTVLSGLGFLFNMTAFVVFITNGKAFGFPIKYVDYFGFQSGTQQKYLHPA